MNLDGRLKLCGKKDVGSIDSQFPTIKSNGLARQSPDAKDMQAAIGGGGERYDIPALRSSPPIGISIYVYNLVRLDGRYHVRGPHLINSSASVQKQNSQT